MNNANNNETNNTQATATANATPWYKNWKIVVPAAAAVAAVAVGIYYVARTGDVDTAMAAGEAASEAVGEAVAEAVQAVA